MLVNRFMSMHHNKMSTRKKKDSRLIWIRTGSWKMEVFSALLFLVTWLNSCATAQSPDYPVAVVRDYPNYLRSSALPFKPSPLLETYFESSDGGITSLGSIESSGSMQNNYLDLFIWNKPMPATSIVNTFLENENELPFLNEISRVCPKRDFFFGMNPRHMMAVSRLKDVLMEQRSPQDCIKMAAGLRDLGEINPHAWLRAVVSATIHRRDMQGLRKPPMLEVMPSMFITNNVLDKLKRSIDVPSHNRKCVLVDGSVGRDNGIENLLWYWREDVMVNSHHWYWHLSYPINGARGQQDREGELFYFMHHSMMARYHSERLSVGLPAVKAYDMQPGSRIPLPYNPHMHDGNSGNNWSPRPAGVPISDIMSDVLPGAPFFISIRNRSIQLGRIFEGISMGSLIDRFGHPVYLDSDEGITLLGNTVEANAFSVNPEFYGYHGIHNNGHNIISLALDPRNELGIPPGVMGEASTAMRDVMFYPYHEFMDSIFNRYKNTLLPYQLTQGDWPLLVHGVTVHSINVQSNNLPRNVLHTFWSSRKYDLSRGLDFNRTFVQGPLWTCVQHLDHQDFEYELKIERKDYAAHAKTVTVRLFMGPRYDVNGRRYTLEEERHFMFILDTFTVPLKLGLNTIRRKSIETPLTIDFPQSLRELQTDGDSAMPFCGCGWPHHLLIPKGNREGLDMDLFAIITNSEEDYVEPLGRAGPQSCRPAYIFCGLMEEKYPDARPMGYPFDRKLFVSDKGHGPSFLEHLVREVPNTGVAHIKVVHYDELKDLGDEYDGTGEDYELPNPVDGNQYLDAGKPIVNHLPVVPAVLHIDGEHGPNSLATGPRLVTSPVSIESGESLERPGQIPGPPPGPPLPPPPPPPPRTILNLRLRHRDQATHAFIHDPVPSFHSVSESNGLDDFIPTVHEEIRSIVDKVNPAAAPPPPPIISPIDSPHQFDDGPLPVKRPFRSPFGRSFRSLLNTFSPVGTIGSTPKSVLAFVG